MNYDVFVTITSRLKMTVHADETEVAGKLAETEIQGLFRQMKLPLPQIEINFTDTAMSGL